MVKPNIDTKSKYKININFDRIIGGNWTGALSESLLNTDYMQNLLWFLKESYKLGGIYPEQKDIFKPFQLVDLSDVKVVILGREPYNNKRATGIPLANYDEYGKRWEPELITFLKAIEHTCYDGFDLGFDPELEHFYSQGVLMFDCALTSEHDIKLSHLDLWRNFTRQVIKTISGWMPGVIFLLLGEEAQKFEKYIKLSDSYVVKGEHPYEAIKEGRSWDATPLEEVNAILLKQNGQGFQIQW